MKTLNNILGKIVLIALIGFFVFYLVTTTKDVKGSAPTGYATQISTSSTITLSGTSGVAFASSTDCTNRVVTVPPAGGARINFGDNAGIVPSATVGHMQAASTTVYYDSGLYGCGQWTIYGTGAMQVTEFRGFK